MFSVYVCGEEPFSGPNDLAIDGSQPFNPQLTWTDSEDDEDGFRVYRPKRECLRCALPVQQPAAVGDVPAGSTAGRHPREPEGDEAVGTV